MLDQTFVSQKAAIDPDNFALANCLRALAIDAVNAANSGHPGAPMGMADAATVLFSKHLKFDASAPDWPDRDRFVLSNGHASMLLYGLLHLTGYEDMTIEQIRNFRQWGAITAGHPEWGHAKGIETTTGPLGQGIATAVGMALAERAMAGEFPGLVDHRTWVMLGDGCLQEGIGQEAISLAGHLGLGKLNVLYDDNDITIDGPTSVSFSENVPARLEACGWHVIRCDGHDAAALDKAMTEAKAETSRPTLIAMKTVIGFGAPNRAGTAKAHGSPLGEEEGALAKAALGWDAAPFDIPADLADAWKAIGARGAQARAEWEDALAASNHADTFRSRIAGELPEGYEAAVTEARKALFDAPQKVATRKASQIALESLTAAVPAMIGGSADLTGSNLTRVPAVDTTFTAETPGRYIGYGVREFGMAAAMNGLALHGGLRPYGGTFLVFSDYARNAIRLSALMGLGVTYVMTHDSIGLGEDGPTHQPIEHLASLRAIPNLNVFRPADAVETLEAWDLALRTPGTPALMALSRQGVPQLREAGDENLTARGGYVIRSYGDRRDVTLLATGTEVSLAVEAAEALHADGVGVAVVSMPCWELFDAQPEAYKAEVLGDAPRIAVEAASPFGWTRYVATEDDVIGLRDFGASAPAERLYDELGITRDAIVTKARVMIAD
ncbi:MAG: transketolase [Rhodobacteraceae bacterium]|jgi:transketolase|uniref:Transketolase n=1 Tax=Salipiger profundus TaxID=1229727 RepID=A0A1U7D4G9_9RHOB|nr:MULTISPECIES: transketolase [Salipiger]APX22965.1 transketolase [Salipiger profundus]MAB04631.1 transketolase [Paracoccaceae bacterium]GGA12343.1 transketolase [Salipiger profundus]SFD22604.1 transketolase [Salipiger profundus]